MDKKATDDSRQFVSCSFCNERFPSSRDMGDHLILCGNKTDQCPKCKQYVRRAVFAYHYENDCAPDPDAPTGPSNHVPKRPDTSSTPRPNNPRVTVTCEFCGQNYDQTDSRVHKENCLKNPANLANKQRLSANGNSNQSSDRPGHFDNFTEIAYVPCEYCNQQIDWGLIKNHTNACRERENRRIQEQSQRTNRETVVYVARCAFCKQMGSLESLGYHESCCTLNPHRNGGFLSHYWPRFF